MSSRPRALSLVLARVRKVHESLCLAFGVRPTYDPALRFEPSNTKKDIYQFFFDCLFDEGQTVEYSESLKSTHDIKQFIIATKKLNIEILIKKPNYFYKGYNYRNLFNDDSFEPTHLFTWRANNNIHQNTPYVFAIIIDNGEIERFLNEIESDKCLNLFEKYLPNKIRCADRRIFINNFRLYGHEIRNKTGENFFADWDRVKYFREIREDPTIFSKIPFIENKIYDNIVALNEKYASGESSSDSTPVEEQEGELGSVAERLAKLDKFAEQNPGQPISGMVLKMFPFLESMIESVMVLPKIAPELWPHDRQEVAGALETPPQFIKRVYGEWEGKGLSKRLIRQLDPTLYRALYNWLQRGNEMPANLDLPTVEQQNDRLVDRILEKRGGGDAEGSFTAREAMREAERLRSALRTRIKE